MGDFGPVLAAVAVTVIGAIGTAFTARRLRSLGLGDDQSSVNAMLREKADLWEEKYNLERAAHVITQADYALERTLGGQCRGDLDDARSKIRLLERRRAPRAGA